VVFIGRREAGDESAVAVADSNGCAAGINPDAAKLAALLELVERDAAGRWWYGRRHRPVVDILSIEGAGDLPAWLLDRRRQTWLFDITTEIDIPAYAAVSAEPEGRAIALGFAAHLNVNAAAISAVTEMVQLEFSLATASRLAGAMPLWEYWQHAVGVHVPPLDATLRQEPVRVKHRSRVDNGTELSAALAACERVGIDLYFADMTRLEIGIPVVRVLSTKLCHYKPRFDRTRLLAPDVHDLCPAARQPGPPWLTI
jgi:ribosomal protein S12 methylthiotransferase accessory factor